MVSLPACAFHSWIKTEHAQRPMGDTARDSEALVDTADSDDDADEYDYDDDSDDETEI